MTKKINKSELSGSFEPDLKFKARHKFENLIEDQLREVGRVPVLDMNTEWYTSWDEENEVYDFVLIMHSVYVGTRKAREEIVGWEKDTESWRLFDG